MANGLDVVTINIPVVKTSAVGDYLHFYDEQTSESIAEAVKNVKIGNLRFSEILKAIDAKFVNDIRELL